MHKSIVKFHKTFENRDIKIAQVNSILSTKSINLKLITLILFGAVLGSVVILTSLN